jgi:DNA repair protein RadC
MDHLPLLAVDGDRPRERLVRLGSDALRDAELLALVLGTGARGVDSLAVAASLLATFSGDLRRLAVAGVAELAALPGVGHAQACRLKAALALATRLGERPYQRGDAIGGPHDILARLGPRLRTLEKEVMIVLGVDSKHRVLVEQRVAEGGVCSVVVHPRDLFAAVVREAAAAMICVHNHPSGDPSPSDADRTMTERLRAAGDLLGVPVLDHVIVAQHGCYSFAQGCLLPAPAPSRRLLD